MKALKVEVKTKVNILVEDDTDYWAIKQEVLNAIHDKIHFLEKDSFYLTYDHQSTTNLGINDGTFYAS